VMLFGAEGGETAVMGLTLVMVQLPVIPSERSESRGTWPWCARAGTFHTEYAETAAEYTEKEMLVSVRGSVLTVPSV
jgi:hypothetical protein